MPWSAQFLRRALIIASAKGSLNGSVRWSVGTMWSTVANVRWGMATLSPRSRSMAKACGLVTSWMRCVPINSWVCPFASWRTAWAAQTFSNRFRGEVRMSRRVDAATIQMRRNRKSRPAPPRLMQVGMLRTQGPKELVELTLKLTAPRHIQHRPRVKRRLARLARLVTV